MKLSTKPISSRGRTDKFPPPLMRFLRTNAGSRSRGKSSKPYPIFIKKKKNNNNNNTAIEITQEPSSPKVTCMGQVIVTRAAAAPTKCNRSFRWVSNPLFCHQNIKPSSNSSIKPGSPSSSCCYFKCKPVWLNWVFLFRRKETKTELNFKNRPNDEESELEDEERVNANAFVSKSYSSTSPPRNALLLTRCRSAPYGSSSLASMFWVSPEETEKECVENRERDESTEQEKEKPNLQRESVLEQEGRKDPKLERKLRFFKELEESLRERIMECELKRREEEEDEEAKGDCGEGPIVLTRCKSEPARTTYKFDPH